MLLPTLPLRIPTTQPLNRAEPVRARRESEQPQQEFARAFAGAQDSGTNTSEQAAVLHFGTRALDLARGEGGEPSGGASDTTPDGADVGAERRRNPRGSAPPKAGIASAPMELTPEEQEQLSELRRRDQEVRAHEQAHQHAGGQYAGAIQLEYEQGPDGGRYAVGGSVAIDVSAVSGDPAATVRKMEVVQRAANAPASPSGADRQVATEAARVSRLARAQIAAERYARAQELA